MRPKAFAIDDLVINDRESLSDAVWVSILKDTLGLPRVTPRFAVRHGRHPKISGIDRSEVNYFLQTVWTSNHAAYRRQLMQYLNPDLEQTRRLLAVDHVPPGCAPDHVLLALGPWDAYCDDGGDWHVRDLLHPDSLEADLSGGWWVSPGDGLQIIETPGNLVDNPSFETGTTNWATGGTNTIAQSSAVARTGHYSLKTTYQDSAYLAAYSITFPGAGDYAVVAHVWIPACYDGDNVRIRHLNLVGANTNVLRSWQVGDATGEWVLLVSIVTVDAGDLEGNLTIQSVDTPSAGEFLYVDDFQAKAGAYPIPSRDGTFPGCSWNGTAHGSTTTGTAAECDLDSHVDLISENETLSFWLRFVAEYDAGEGWPDEAILFDARGSSDNDRIYVEFEDSDDKFHVYINGADRFQSSVQTFERGAEVDLVLTLDFDNDSYVLYVDGPADGRDSTGLSAPTLTAWRLGSDYDGANQANCAHLLYYVFDHVVSAAEAALLATQDINARWLDVMCHSCDPWAPNGRPLYFGLVSGLAIDGDVRWRQRDGDVHFWRCYDGDEATVVAVSTDDDVYPEFRITPRTAKTTGFTYKQWQAIKWPSSHAATDYPVMLGAFNLTGKAQADGDDIRVYVDGEEVDRWLGGTLVSAVKVWINLDFESDISLTLAEAIAASGAIDYIQFNEDISDLPVEGLIYVESEVFYYTDKNNRTKKVSGITRATRGTSEAGHTAGTTADWIQHDVYVYYGDGALSAPTVDDDYKPALDLDSSTNSSHVYADFGEDDGLRPLQWTRQDVHDSPAFYDADHGTSADPWEELGVRCNGLEEGRCEIYCPCGISAVNFSNGEKRENGTNFYWWGPKVQSSIDGSSWTAEYSIPAPSANNTWESWSYSAAITAGSFHVGLYCNAGQDSNERYVECADVTLTISDPVTVTAGTEQNNYSLACTITNEATGEVVTISAEMILDQTLVVNTNEKSVTLDDGTRLATAVVTDTARRDWLRLVDGDNVLTFEDAGTEEIEIDILWDRRLFE